MEDEHGNKAAFTVKAESKLEYHYCETFGNSLNRNQTVLTVLNEKEINTTTINQIKRSGKHIITITELDKDAIDKRLQRNDIKYHAAFCYPAGKWVIQRSDSSSKKQCHHRYQ
ncbi:MAG TPA: hypothetical protein ACHBX0_09840 [Arsenophonus sp.]